MVGQITPPQKHRRLKSNAQWVANPRNQDITIVVVIVVVVVVIIIIIIIRPVYRLLFWAISSSKSYESNQLQSHVTAEL